MVGEGNNKIASADGSARALTGSLVAGMAAYVVVYHHPALSGLGPLKNLAATLIATLPYAVAVRCFVEHPLTRSSRDTVLLYGGLIALRLCIPLEGLVGSDDAYRYLWDGLVLDHGINPFDHAPQAAALASLRDEVFFPFIYRPDMKTVYPPLAQLWFWLAYKLTPESFVGLKLILLAHDCASVAILTRLLQQIGLPPQRALIYAWSPLAVIQLFAGAHLDGLLIPWCLLSLLLAQQRPLAAGAALAASAMVRPLMLICLPALLLRRPLLETAKGTLGFIAVVAAMSAPFAAAGVRLFESLWVYARHWRFNGSLFLLFEAIFGKRRIIRFSAYGGIATLAFGSSLLPIGRPQRYLLALGSYFALAPTVYPWYLLTMVAIGSLFSGPLVVSLPALVCLSDLVFVTKAFGGRWRVPLPALLVEYGLIYALTLLEVIRNRTWRGRVCVFAKPPVPGQAKTRLIPLLGAEGAAALAREFLEHTWAAVSKIRWARSVVATTGLLDLQAEQWPQGDGDLGQKMERVLRRALQDAPFAIVIGTDSDGLPPRLMEQARQALRTHDAVLGPAEDGGFYLIGLRRCPEGLLDDLPWSCETTFEATKSRLEATNLSVSIIETWFDIDTPEDRDRIRVFNRLK